MQSFRSFSHLKTNAVPPNIAISEAEPNDNDLALGSPNDLHFEMDVDVDIVQPIQILPRVIDASFTEDDHNALRQCTALQESNVVIEDLRPLTTSPLEYSYRRPSDVPLSSNASFWKLPTTTATGQENNPEGSKRSVSSPTVLVGFFFYFIRRTIHFLEFHVAKKCQFIRLSI